MGSGNHPEDVFRQLVAEIAEHHASGQITNRDAHRAANEALGRLMMARKRRPFQGARKQAWSGWGSPERHHRVAGWDWDDHQNGYVTTSARQFECSCGEPVEVPSYHNCKCGKIWNAYVIGTGGDRHEASAEKFIAREIPRRDGVVVARKRVAADHFHDDSGRYTGPTKTNTSFPPDPYGGSDHCPECGNHFAQGHDAECGRISKWGNSGHGGLQSDGDKGEDEERVSPFPSDHSPKVDTRSKGVQDGKSTKDWHKRDHGTQQFRG